MRRALTVAVSTVVLWHVTSLPGAAGVITFDPLPVPVQDGKLYDSGGHFPYTYSLTSGNYYVEMFRANSIGTPIGAFGSTSYQISDSDPSPFTSDYAFAHIFGGEDQLWGLMIERTDGGTFTLQSLTYQLAGLQTIDGFPGEYAVLVAGAFDPRASVKSQFTAFPWGGSRNTWYTLTVSGFEDVSRVFLATSAAGWIDDIVLEDTVAAVPEPGSIVLLGGGALGMLGLSRRRRIK